MKTIGCIIGISVPRRRQSPGKAAIVLLDHRGTTATIRYMSRSTERYARIHSHRSALDLQPPTLSEQDILNVIEAANADPALKDMANVARFS